MCCWSLGLSLPAYVPPENDTVTARSSHHAPEFKQCQKIMTLVFLEQLSFWRNTDSGGKCVLGLVVEKRWRVSIKWLTRGSCSSVSRNKLSLLVISCYATPFGFNFSKCPWTSFFSVVQCESATDDWYAPWILIEEIFSGVAEAECSLFQILSSLVSYTNAVLHFRLQLRKSVSGSQP